VKYEKPLESVRQVVDLAGGLDDIPRRAKVFIKPNIVLWTDFQPFPKWGLITTSRVIEDTVVHLKERGVDNITIGEGPVLLDPKDKDLVLNAFEGLGYGTLKKRYGVKLINVFRRPYEKVDLGDGVQLNFNSDFLESDFSVNVPVMKTHSQTVVSLGIKNIKGMIDVNSRKKCHSSDLQKDLHFMVARLADRLPPSFTILDGIFTNERGPGFDGKMRRSNLLVASKDVFAADKVGARLLGYDPSQVPYLVHAAANRNRPIDLSDVELRGADIEEAALALAHAFDYTDDGALPVFMAKKGIRGLSFRKYDTSLCTYCFTLTGLIMGSIALAWKGEPWDDVEVLTGKMMKPSAGKKKTILLGKCIYAANKDHPNIENMIAVKGCPPSRDEIVRALHEAGVLVDPSLIQHPEKAPSLAYRKYEGKPEFDESFFRIE
jgi:uncharacterized protein (DUF362 family)